MSALPKDKTINLRVDENTLALLHQAASISGKTLTAFVTEASRHAAQNELLEQRFVGVDASTFDAIHAATSGKGKANETLADLLHREFDWAD